MHELLKAGRKDGTIRPGINLALLADRLCQSMLNVGVGVSHVTPGGELVPDLRMKILLHGIAHRSPADSALDRSNALRTARRAIETWDGENEEADERLTHLFAVARAEFGRRGYESTTMRDIAAAAEMSTGSVYRLLGSKDQLLFDIMSSYSEKVVSAWDAVVRSDSPPLAKVDALIWVAINVVDRFSDEVRISLAWMRQSPPSTPTSPSLGVFLPAQLRHVRALMAAGAKSNDLHYEGGSADIRARCLLEAIWGAGSSVATAGIEGTHAFARDTVLRGAAAYD
jgi:AcrR family transcriptional regulator